MTKDASISQASPDFFTFAPYHDLTVHVSQGILRGLGEMGNSKN